MMVIESSYAKYSVMIRINRNAILHTNVKGPFTLSALVQSAILNQAISQLQHHTFDMVWLYA